MTEDNTKLRDQAEYELTAKPPIAKPIPPEKLLHELHVYQIELEMQNETLHQSQIALEESRDRYVDLYEFAPVGYLSLTPDGLIAEANLTATTGLGIDRIKLLQRRFSQFVAPEDRELWEYAFVSLMNSSQPKILELALRREDRTVMDVRLHCTRRDRDETHPVLRIAFSDITEFKAADKQLRKLSLAVEQSPISIMITNTTGVIEFVNPACCLNSGYAAAELIGQNPRLLQSGLTPTATYQALRNSLTAGKVWQGQFINRHKDGSLYTDAATISPLRQTNGQITHYVSVQENITPLKQAMDELVIAGNRLRLAQTSTGLGVYDRNLVNRTIDWDTRAREIFGVELNEVITHQKFMEIVHPDDRKATQAAFDHALASIDTGSYQIPYRIINRKDKKIHYIEADGKVFFDAGKPIRLVGVVRDVTDSKQLEQELKAQRNAMGLLINRQVASQTAAAIAHEINQPLASISAYSEAALQMLKSGNQNPEKLEHALQSAVAQSQRAGRSLHELLEFLHQGDIALEPVDLNEVVCDALAAAEESGCDGFSPKIELSPDIQPVLSNYLQLQKVLINLFCNSAEAMHAAGIQRGEITIRIQTIAGKKMALTTIQDSGPGLDAASAQRIFEPFFTTKSKGVGLGLAISRALIEAQGGQLWVDASADSGAVFHFTLPYCS